MLYKRKRGKTPEIRDDYHTYTDSVRAYESYALFALSSK